MLLWVLYIWVGAPRRGRSFYFFSSFLLVGVYNSDIKPTLPPFSVVSPALKSQNDVCVSHNEDEDVKNGGKGEDVLSNDCTQ